MSWGTLGSTIELEGASGRTWNIKFERRLAPRESSSITNPASSVWLIRDQNSKTLYAAKRQALASLTEVDALVDEAAAWRAACLADNSKHIVELVDVFVERSSPHSATFLAEFCARGLLPRANLSEPVLLTLMADLSTAAMAMPSPHAHIAYESLLVDGNGRIRLAGFGAHRSAILRDNPGLTDSDDAFDIGIVVFELVFGHPPSDDLAIPSESSYSPRLISLIETALGHPRPSDLREAAIAAGAEPEAPVIDIDSSAVEKSSAPAPEHVLRSTERNVDRLLEGVDIATTFQAIISDLEADAPAVSASIFRALFKKPVSKDPSCAVRCLTMLHNLMLDGPDGMLMGIRKNDKFMEWAESSWTREAVTEKLRGGDSDRATAAFVGGELSFYAVLLRRKARFHQLAAGGFSGRWDRTGATNPDGRDVLETRRRKVISGMADVTEMTSELGCLFAAAKDEEAPAKHAGLGAMVSECCLAYNAALELAHEVHSVRDAEKLMPGIDRLYAAARTLVFAVEVVPSAGGEPWVEQFANESPPDLIADIELRQRMGDDAVDGANFPQEGWEGVEVGLREGEETEKSKKKKKKKKRAKDEEAKKEDVEADEKADITAADGALVVHGTDEASNAVTAMVGDLLRIDEQKEQVDTVVPEVRPSAGMSNAQALASAFGVPEEAVTAGYDEGYRNGYGDEDGDEDGGYEDYQARQEGSFERTRESRVPSTAAWAAKAGYGTRALVVSENSSVKKSHPVFCQCAICQQEESQAAALEEEMRQTGQSGHVGYEGGRAHDERYDGEGEGDGRQRNDRDTKYVRGEYAGRGYNDRYADNGDRDSLDDDEGERETWKQKDESNRPLYDDYDSYESVEYAMDNKRETAPGGRGQSASAIPLGSAVMTDNMAPAGGYRYAPPVEEFKLEKAKVLNMKKLRTGDKISDSDMIVVYKGEYNRETVAVKKVTKKGLQSTGTLDEFRNEVQLTCSLLHPNVIKCIAASLQKPNFVFVTEWMKRGTLFDVLYKSRIKLTWALIRKIALQIAEGMSHVHEAGFVHRDLKSLNVFTDGGYDVKIGDFGLACHVSEAVHGGNDISGTYQYMAPEVLKGEAHTCKSDVYSFAILLCEMISGTLPFNGADARQVAERVVNEDLRPTIPMHCQRSYMTLIQKCWATVPSIRPTFPQIVDLIKVVQ